ncbi:MAG: hypothetical protein Q8L98_07755 [Chlamydiales bacterium]|nr:hypothetical protein [Chlamydiales bacterium]
MEIDLRNTLSFNGIFNSLATSSVDKQKIAAEHRKPAIAQTSYNYQQIAFNTATVGIVAAAVFATFSYLSIPVSGLAIGAFWLARQIIVTDINMKISGFVKDVDQSENSEKIMDAMSAKGVSVASDWKAVAHKMTWPFEIVLWRNTIVSEKTVKGSAGLGYTPSAQY